MLGIDYSSAVSLSPEYSSVGGPPAQQSAVTGYDLPSPQTAVTYSGPFAGLALGGKPFAFYLGLVLVLMVARMAQQTSDEEDRLPELTPQFVILVGLSSAVFNIGWKVVANRWYIPGLSEVVNLS